jgi:ABC-type uncharacterized transport system permease subunit
MRLDAANTARQQPYTAGMILSPALLSAVATLVAAGAYGVAAAWPGRNVPSSDDLPGAPPTRDVARWSLTIGWLFHAVAIGTDALDWSATPLLARFGFAPALSVMLWIVLAVYALEQLHRQSHWVRKSVAALAACAVLLAWAFPGQVHPKMGQGLAPLHWLLGLASYGLFGAALLHAVFLRLAEQKMRGHSPAQLLNSPGIPLLKLESLTLRFVLAGFVVLSLTLILGALFAQPLRLDHKTALSVMAWGVFAVLLAGRHWMGWRGKTAIAWLYAGSALLLLAYVGSRFVLEVVLHRPPSPY